MSEIKGQLSPDSRDVELERAAEERYPINPQRWGLIPCHNDSILMERKAFLAGARFERDRMNAQKTRALEDSINHDHFNFQPEE